jgi:hypothetical protein
MMAINIMIAMLLELVLLSGMISMCAQVARPPLDVGKTADVTLAEWVKQNQVTVPPTARAEINSKFSQEQQFLQEKFGARRLSSDQQTSLLELLVKEYMYDLRDGSKIPGSIQTSDVATFSPGNFLRRKETVLDGDSGRLEVTSNPKEASIRIDRTGAGKTCRPFVLSVGAHTIEVTKKEAGLHCRGTINVKKDADEKFSCPPNTSCP